MNAPAAPLRIVVGIVRRGVFVEVGGEIDLTTAPTLAGVLSGVADSGAKSIALDVGAVEYMGAAGVRIIEELSRRLSKNDGNLVLRRPTRMILRLLRLFDLDGLADTAPTDDWQSVPDDLVVVADEGARRALLDAALHAILTAIPPSAGFDGGSVTLHRNGQPITVAASGPTYEQLDLVQYDAGEGPCLAALATGEVVRIGDVRTDRRWPVFARAAAAASIDSVLSTPLAGISQSVGALNLYASKADTLGDGSVRAAAAAAHAASALLQSASAQSTDAELRHRLSDILDARQTIAQAQGVLAEREGLTMYAAYALLAQRAREDGVGLHTFAVDVVRGTPGSAARRPMHGDPGRGSNA